ncbi:PREDICTED: uncharacterized protein LOC106804833 [Priapulus caudatus]|uniref:Uncharacterized protein LOC106804833 n=1 Tax=Priapulus caudatus TaxID=37621 RepID=A0ABM1DP01_PRICU|nr:PREDICTED: uncharacterized protein LOC106804833 [Priapulus caudatus]XP_014661673.1 PREDICTED: uncharacterized protein LOC106804833 [Priapulus caudatus]
MPVEGLEKNDSRRGKKNKKARNRKRKAEQKKSDEREKMAMAGHQQAGIINGTSDASDQFSAEEDVASLDEGIERCARLLANMAELGGLKDTPNLLSCLFNQSLPCSTNILPDMQNQPRAYLHPERGGSPHAFEKTVLPYIIPPPLVSVTNTRDSPIVPNIYAVIESMGLSSESTSPNLGSQKIGTSDTAQELGAETVDLQSDESDSISSVVQLLNGGVMEEKVENCRQEEQIQRGCDSAFISQDLQENGIQPQPSSYTNNVMQTGGTEYYQSYDPQSPNWITPTCEHPYSQLPAPMLSFQMPLLTSQAPQSFMSGAPFTSSLVTVAQTPGSYSHDVPAHLTNQGDACHLRNRPSAASRQGQSRAVHVSGASGNNTEASISFPQPVCSINCSSKAEPQPSIKKSPKKQLPESRKGEFTNWLQDEKPKSVACATGATPKQVKGASMSNSPNFSDQAGKPYNGIPMKSSIDVTNKIYNLPNIDDSPISGPLLQSGPSPNNNRPMMQEERNDPSGGRDAVKMLMKCTEDLKLMLGNRGDRRAVQLVQELEMAVGRLPVVMEHRDVQTQIDMALQPLRSENCQLKRRIRIINQQLRERERAERSHHNFDTTFEMELEALNVRLQIDLEEEKQQNQFLQSTVEDLQRELRELDIDNQKLKEDLEMSSNSVDLARLQSELSEVMMKTDATRIRFQALQEQNDLLRTRMKRKDVEVTRMQVYKWEIEYTLSELLKEIECNGASSLEKLYTIIKAQFENSAATGGINGYSKAQDLCTEPGHASEIDPPRTSSEHRPSHRLPNEPPSGMTSRAAAAADGCDDAPAQSATPAASRTAIYGVDAQVSCSSPSERGASSADATLTSFASWKHAVNASANQSDVINGGGVGSDETGCADKAASLVRALAEPLVPSLISDVVNDSLSSGSLTFHSLRILNGQIVEASAGERAAARALPGRDQSGPGSCAGLSKSNAAQVGCASVEQKGACRDELDEMFASLVVDKSVSGRSSQAESSASLGGGGAQDGAGAAGVLPPAASSKRHILQKFLSDVQSRSGGVRNGDAQQLTKWQSSPDLIGLAGTNGTYPAESAEPGSPMQRSCSMQYVNNSNGFCNSKVVSETVSSLRSSDDMEFCKGLEELDSRIATLEKCFQQCQTGSM